MECPVRSGNLIVLLEYASGRLSAGSAADLVGHIAGCRECTAWTAGQTEVWETLESWTPPPVSGEFDQKVLARVARERGRQSWWAAALGRWSWRPVLPVAVALVLLMFVLVSHRTSRVSQPVTRPAHAQTDAIDADRLEKALDDVEMLRQVTAEAM